MPKPKVAHVVLPAHLTTFTVTVHHPQGRRVPVLTDYQRQILLTPKGKYEAEKDAIHRAILDLFHAAYCHQCLSAGLLPAVHPVDIDWPDDAEWPVAVCEGRGLVRRCVYHGCTSKGIL